MYKVLKRDGKIVDFDLTKIKKAIVSAFDASQTFYTDDVIDLLALKTTSVFQAKIMDGLISVENIQDSIETVLIKSGYDEVSKAFMSYRRQRAADRGAVGTVLDYKKLVDDYLHINDWRVKENSTVTYSVGGLILGNSGAITANYWLSEVYDEEIANAHKNADIHIHDLSMLTGYCFTGDTRVKTLDGKNPTFKELVENGVQELLVYAYDLNTKKIVPAKAVRPRITRKVYQIMKIDLNTDEEICCTVDHLFMLNDGTYVPASQLKKGDELMTFDQLKSIKVDWVGTVVNDPNDLIDVYDLTVPGYDNFALDAGIFVHNCAGWSLKQLIKEGLGGVPGKTTSAPAKHLSTLCNQMVNFLGILQNEWAGKIC